MQVTPDVAVTVPAENAHDASDPVPNVAATERPELAVTDAVL
jgi:hypothetical protein